VRLQQQIARDLADRRATGGETAAHGKQQLMLRRRDARRPRPLLAPTQETPQAGSEREQLLEFGITQIH
jgi:hypothetical protein